jgi:sugar phosphate isomerase/epimerase
MKLAFSAWAMREAPVEVQIDIVRRAGYVGICLVSGPGFSLDALSADAAERRRIRRLLDDADLALTGLAGHANLLVSDADQRLANVARITANLGLAADLGGKDGPPPVISMGYGTPEGYLADRELLAERFGELAAYASTTGGAVALEAHVGQAIDLPEKVDWLMRAVDSPQFRFNLDNSHFEVMGRDMDDYLPLVAPYAVHTDLKDQRGRSPEHEFLVPGEGDFDYARYLRAMEAVGYTGYVTIEISVMVQRRPGYDPAEVARRSFDTLVAASRAAGVGLVHRGAALGAA